jgi:hypothetical protein
MPLRISRRSIMPGTSANRNHSTRSDPLCSTVSQISHRRDRHRTPQGPNRTSPVQPAADSPPRPANSTSQPPWSSSSSPQPHPPTGKLTPTAPAPPHGGTQPLPPARILRRPPAKSQQAPRVRIPPLRFNLNDPRSQAESVHCRLAAPTVVSRSVSSHMEGGREGVAAAFVLGAAADARALDRTAGASRGGGWRPRRGCRRRPSRSGAGRRGRQAGPRAPRDRSPRAGRLRRHRHAPRRRACRPRSGP